MLRTPYHALLSRHDFDLLRRHQPALLDEPHWIEERVEALGPDSPVRLFYSSPEHKSDHQLAILRGLAKLRRVTTDHDTD